MRQETPESIAVAQVRYMRRVGFTPDTAAQAVGWNVPAGVIGWDDITEAFAQVAAEMLETLANRALSGCPKTATGAVLAAPRPAGPSTDGLVKAGYGRLKTFDGFKDWRSAAEFQACRQRHARIRAVPSLMDMPRPTKRGVH
jgi:hypothetical protein